MHRTPLWLLYLNVLVIATCGLIYELLAGTLASYVLGDSVTQFSLVIGVYLFALGAGAWLSRFVTTALGRTFIEVEYGVALLGGFSAPLLFLSFAYLDAFRPFLFTMVFLIGTLVGLELPLLMRILKEHLEFEELVSRVLTFDYIGALVASVMFPMLLVPRLGLVRTSLAFGLLNALVGLWGTHLLRPILSSRGLASLRFRGVVVVIVLVIGLIKADRLTTIAEEGVFEHPIVYAHTSPFQRLVLTQSPNGFQLWLNGHLQFNSIDEYRYHEALVHPAFAARPGSKRILILGGGDGLALREVLRYPTVESVTLVDLDPAMTSLHEHFPPLKTLAADCYADPRVRVINDDAYLWAGRQSPRDQPFDLVLIDFPDPNSFSVGKLYTSRFYNLLRRCVSDDAIVSIQCTSPLIAPQSYWCILKTMESAGFHVAPFQATVPSFGVWGFALASPSPVNRPARLAPAIVGQIRFLNDESLASLFELPADLQPRDVEINRLDSQALVRYYESEWRQWN
ncbi:Spermidine synthase [Caulifigura coniformis]|uniref:Polyamine aminopropyltransferase n=1 Tax=Caulifigura coniformis TaxID=2527983 RepID=A0A517S7W0_9PLAN|nr:polyamine aminopropyltransferase [Caulifigura coniformis]QDT52210.1 Spermidine synthase [Caulifigura coniformis]